MIIIFRLNKKEIGKRVYYQLEIIELVLRQKIWKFSSNKNILQNIFDYIEVEKLLL